MTKIKNGPRSFNYKSDYRCSIALQSFVNHNETVKQALEIIYNNHNLKLDDFDRSFVSKLISDELVEVANPSKLDVIRGHASVATTLRITAEGCRIIEKPFF